MTYYTDRNHSTSYDSDSRVGDADREATVEHLNQAYASGHLDEVDVAERRDQAFEAKVVRDLRALVKDLPAFAEKKSHVRLRAAHPIRRYQRLDDAGKAWVWFLTMPFWAAWGIVPSAEIAAAHPGHLGAVWPLFIGFFVITGITGFLGGLFAGLTHAADA